MSFIFTGDIFSVLETHSDSHIIFNVHVVLGSSHLGQFLTVLILDHCDNVYAQLLSTLFWCSLCLVEEDHRSRCRVITPCQGCSLTWWLNVDDADLEMFMGTVFSSFFYYKVLPFPSLSFLVFLWQEVTIWSPDLKNEELGVSHLRIESV